MELKEKAIEAIANKERRNILYLLDNADKNFTEIQTELRVDKSSLTYHMKKLVSLGLVANIYERRANSKPRVHSYYKLTSFGNYVADWYRAFMTKKGKTYWIKCQNCGHYVEAEINEKGAVVNA
jgi:predicted transcriptional regulator